MKSFILFVISVLIDIDWCIIFVVLEVLIILK